MKICPIAIAVGCRRCPVFKLCPVKGLIGDYEASAPARKTAAKKATRTAAKKASTRRR